MDQNVFFRLNFVNTALHFAYSQALHKFKEAGDTQDINEAVDIAEQAFTSLPESFPGHDVWLSLIIQALNFRIVQFGPGEAAQNDIDVVCALQELLVCTYRSKLTSAVEQLRVQYVRNPTHSKTVFEDAMSLLPREQALQSNVLQNAESHSLFLRFKDTGAISDLDKAIALARETQEGAVPAKDQFERMRLIHLARCLSQRYDETGNIINLDEALDFAEEAFDESKKRKVGASFISQQLVEILHKRWTRLRRIEDLDKAVLRAKESENLLSPIEKDSRADCLANLADALAYRALATSSSEGLSQGIALMERAFRETTAYKDEYQFALGSFYFQRYFSRLGYSSDLYNAEEIFRETAQRKLSKKEKVDDLLLERLFSTAFERERQAGFEGESLVDVQSMLSRYLPNLERQAVKDLPRGVHYSIAYAFHCRFFAKRPPSALQAWEPSKRKILGKVIHHLEKSRPVGQDDHPDMVTARSLLGGVYMDKHFHEKPYATSSESLNSLSTALEHLQAVANHPEARPFLRVHAARQAIMLMTKNDMVEKAAELACITVDVLPKLCSRSLDRDEQQNNAEVPGFVSDVCALALYEADIPEALRRVELGRCMTLGHLMDGRRDISELQKKHPKRAETYDRLRFLANKRVKPGDDAATRHRRIEQRQDAAEQLDRLETEIRGLEGFETFLLPMTMDDCKREAEHGPIIIINMTSFRSDAIIVTPRDFVHLELKDMKSKAPISLFGNDEAFRRRGVIGRGEMIAMSQAQIEIEERIRNGTVCSEDEVDMAEWLWSTCVKHVLEKLSEINAIRPVGEQRVWWVGMGLASSLPFGAAGIRGEGGQFEQSKDCLTRVISSYIPTIKALHYARMYPRPSIAEHQALLSQVPMLMVTMPTTPHQSPLNGVQQEEQAVKGVMENIESLLHPSSQQVLEAIKRYQIAHFACHGSSDSTDPSQSHLLLRVKNEYFGILPNEYRIDKLAVSDLLDIQQDGPRWLAYLSACSTAEVRSARLSEESIHLVSAFQLSGFRHVIGALWPTGDQVCAEAAKIFYESLVRWYPRCMDSDFAVAVSLRDAIVSIRQKYPADFKLWAAYIHSGA